MILFSELLWILHKKNHHQLSIIMGDLEAASEREKRLQEQLESNTANKKLTTTQLSEAQGNSLILLYT